jgi:YhcH/YjgK/YiaL family protein
MIVGTLENIDEEARLYPNALRTALRYLRDADVAALANGKHGVDGDRIVALVSEYDTEPAAACRFEAHRKHVDVQYIVAGAETIGVAPVHADYEITEDYLAERDVLFYRAVRGAIDLTLAAGQFAVFFPWDAHRPNCHAGCGADSGADSRAEGACARVKKVVVKVPFDLL